MLAALVMTAAAGATLGVWPQEMGPPATVVQSVEVYTVDPEDDYWVIAVQPLAPAVAADDPAALAAVARTAYRLGADAAVLLGELPAEAIPDDVDQPLEPTGRYALVAYVGFLDADSDEDDALPLQARGSTAEPEVCDGTAARSQSSLDRMRDGLRANG